MCGLGGPTNQRATLGIKYVSEIGIMGHAQFTKKFRSVFQMTRKTWRIVHRLGFISLSLIKTSIVASDLKLQFQFNIDQIITMAICFCASFLTRGELK